MVLRRITRSVALIALLLALAGGSGVAAGGASADRVGGKNPGTYSNPLEPQIPGDGVVESCADPTVIRGQGDDPYWYMYCTTDPLNDEDLDTKGNLIFHRIPQMRSLDLVNWEYVGDAFPGGPTGLPDWAADNAALWAPEVVYSTEFNQYYMFFVVTETDLGFDAAGSPCGGDNAIGVAVSDSPTGPWEFSDSPVVAPRQNGTTCNFFWTFDPDVLGDRIGIESYLYYGSYYGGIYGTKVTLNETGALAGGNVTKVAIDNKYEAANVVYRDGFYYLFVSATNCCNGALTGYSVFVGRSASPLGPFVDKEGVPLSAEPIPGGTPVISMNGNRWVGTGHNTVFQDAAGDWWTIYHAVDQQDPFFETQPGFTKRPALLDALDWVGGWPTVNGGNWASDRSMPAPAGQAGEVSRHHTRLVKTQQPTKLIWADEFSGTTLESAWTWDNNKLSGPPQHTVSGGALSVHIQKGDLYVDSNNASVLTREAPKGDYVVEVAVATDVPDSPVCCYNYAQGGVLVYENEDNFVKLTNTSIWNTRQTEWAKELAPVPTGWSRYGNSIVGPPSASGQWTYLRIVVERLTGKESRQAGGDTASYTAYTSQDGQTWVRGGTWTHTLGDADIGLVAMGLTQEVTGDYTAKFDYVRVYRLKESASR